MQWYGVYHLKRDVARAKSWVLNHNNEVVTEQPDWADKYTNSEGKQRRLQWKNHELWGMEYYKDLMQKFLAEDAPDGHSSLKTETHTAIRYVLRNDSYKWMMTMARSTPMLMATKTQSVRHDDAVGLYTLKTGYGEEPTRLSDFGWMKSWKSRQLLDKQQCKDFTDFIYRNTQLIDLCEAKLNAMDMSLAHKNRLMQVKNIKGQLDQAQEWADTHAKSMDENMVKWEAQEAWIAAMPAHFTDNQRTFPMYNIRGALKENPKRTMGRANDNLERLKKQHKSMVEAIEQYESVHGVNE